MMLKSTKPLNSTLLAVKNKPYKCSPFYENLSVSAKTEGVQIISGINNTLAGD
jgi:hypothetical protein